ncbi:MAG: hypothetical protein ACOH2L_16380 [Devosia sp.]
MNTKFGIESGPTITELEVSVDFTPSEPNQASRDLMFGILVRHHLPVIDLFGSPMSRPRFATRRGPASIKHVFRDRPAIRDLFEELAWTTKHDRQVVVDATYYVGAKDAPVQWSTMDKVKDKQNIAAGTFVELSEKDRKTRIEVTLRNEALTDLGLCNLEDLSTLNFRGLQKKFFNFKLATFETRPLGQRKAVSEAIERSRAEKFLVTGVIGLMGQDAVRMQFRKANRPAVLQHLHQQGKKVKAADRRGSGVSGTTLSFAELNKAVETALRHLGERVSK